MSFTVTAATELTLGANAQLDSVHRLQWKTTGDKGILQLRHLKKDNSLVPLWTYIMNESLIHQQASFTSYTTLTTTPTKLLMYFTSHRYTAVCMSSACALCVYMTVHLFLLPTLSPLYPPFLFLPSPPTNFFLPSSLPFPLFFLTPGKYYGSKPVKGPDFTVELKPMEIRTFDLTVQPN